MILALVAFHANAQVGINNISPNASLDISASNQASPANNDGILVPRIDAFPASDPGAAQNSMIVYLTTTDGGNPPGFYFWNQSTLSWDSLTSAGADEINDLTDGINDGSSVFLGNNAGANDDGSNSNVGIGHSAMAAVTSGNYNIALGHRALETMTTGSDNVGIGYLSLNALSSGGNNVGIGTFALLGNTTGNSNIAVGSDALRFNSTGSFNTAIGSAALRSNTANNNTAVGYSSLLSNSSGSENTAVGTLSLRVNSTGDNNTAVGSSALANNSTGENNTATGRQALAINSTGNDNTAFGFQAGLLNTTGFQNTAVGSASLDQNSTGYDNVSVGYSAMGSNTSGRFNAALGSGALSDNTTGLENTALGANAIGSNTQGSYNIGVGSNALTGPTRSSHNVAIGYNSITNNTSNTAVSYNIGIGTQTLNGLVSGRRNIGIGAFSGEAITSGIGNVGLGYGTLETSTTADYNVALGYEAGGDNTSGDYNVYVGYQSGERGTTAGTNTFIGSFTGFTNSTGTGNVFLGNRAGYFETGSNKLYIDNTNTALPLVWGDFSTDDFRINGSLQVGNPATTGYEFPAVDGSANQVLQTDGSGNISWANTDSWTDTGTYIYPPDGTGENILLGTITGNNHKLSVNSGLTRVDIVPNSGSTDMVGITSGSGNATGLNIDLTSSYTLSNRTAISTNLTYGGVEAQMGRFETGTFHTYGFRTRIPTGLGGGAIEYGIYSDVQTSNGFAGYFLGDVAIGTSAANTYTFPASRGTNGQVLQTDGSGNVSWQNISSGEWTDGGSYLTTGDGTTENVLIGTTTPVNYKMRLVSTGSGGTTIDMANTAINSDAMLVQSTNSTGDGLDINLSSGYNLASRSAIDASLTYGGVDTQIARFETGVGNLYGVKIDMSTNLTGTEYGVYSDVQTANGFAGYFLGDVGIGTAASNVYTLPASRGTNGQVMTTDGVGNVSWTTLTTGESTTASNGLAESGDDVRLGGSLIQATTITQGLYNMIFDLTSSGYFEVQDSGTAKFRVSNTGNTRIGGDLQVNQSSVTGTRLIDLNSAGSTGLVDVYAGGIQTARIAGTGDSYINGGPFGVGITNPQEVLDVVGNTSTAYIGDFYNESTSSLADGISIRLAATNPNASAYYIAFQRSGTTTAGRISGTGTGVQYVTTSDARLKTNFKKVNGALEMISRINPRWYEFKEELGKQEMGFLAQELQTVFPQAVSGDANSDPTTDPMMVDYSRMTPLLTAGIQELENKVTRLEDDVYKLKAENTKLKEELKKYQALEARIAALEGAKNSEDSSPIVASKEE